MFSISAWRWRTIPASISDPVLICSLCDPTSFRLSHFLVSSSFLFFSSPLVFLSVSNLDEHVLSASRKQPLKSSVSPPLHPSAFVFGVVRHCFSAKLSQAEVVSKVNSCLDLQIEISLQLTQKIKKRETVYNLTVKGCPTPLKSGSSSQFW